MVTRIVAPEVAKKAAKAVKKNATRAATGMLGLSGERMTKVDTAWLRMDSPSNLMMIVGVWTLKPGIKYADLCLRVQERLLKYNRFRQKVVEDAAGATWVEDRNFDIANHVTVEKLPRHARGQAQQALQKRVGELAMQPLDPKHPLWHFSLIEDYEGGSAMLVRIHHCIADGIALISVTMSLVDGGAPAPGKGELVLRHGHAVQFHGTHQRRQRQRDPALLPGIPQHHRVDVQAVAQLAFFEHHLT